jgi:uncharacterized protein YcnI
MRFNVWSSLVISVCSALVFASAASAHLSIDPQRVQPGAEVDLVFSVPNEDDAVGVDHVTLGIPADFELDDAEAKPGWTQSRTGQAITWSGGLIPKGQFARFTIRGTAPAKTETVLFNVLVGDRTGKSITYRVGLDVAAVTTKDKSARSLAQAALVIAIVAAVLALVALFAWVYRWIRPTAA